MEHRDPHFCRICGLCVCGCDECGRLRCGCLDCPCMDQDDDPHLSPDHEHED